MNVLIAEDDPIASRVVERAVKALGHEAEVASDGATAWTLFQRSAPDVVISDWFMPGLDGLELSRRVRAHARESYVYVILVTGSRGRGSMQQAMEAGADDFLVKPVDLDELAVRLIVAGRITSLDRRTRAAEDRAATLERQMRSSTGIEGIIGASAAMQDVFRRLRLAAQSDVTALLFGESGTGKEVAARALHAQGPRRDGPFLAINCGAIPDALLESELFGHARGAFTGAHQARTGLFEAAGGGTIFLDEIGDVSPALQLKLLRALQEREIRRVGEEQMRKIDVRIVAATNKDLRKLVAEGRVREDFFYRIRVFEISLPPLRERRDDIPLLVEHFLGQMAAAQSRPRKVMSNDALRLLMDHPWPGNIRELRNAIEHALVVAEGNQIEVEDLPVEICAPVAAPRATGAPAAGEDVERILAALKRSGGNRIEAARELGISRVTLWKRMKRFGITPDA